MLTFDIEFNCSEYMNMEFFEKTSCFDIGLESKYYAPPVVYYEGDYDVTPSDSLQILNTEGKFLAEDIVVAPIPDNYALITWNGSTLSVT